MKALVIGATGSTGRHLVSLLLQDKDYTEVVIFVRRSTGRKHLKLTEHLIDFSNLKHYKDLIKGDVVFSCIGTTLKAAGSKENQWRIDFDIPADFATIAKQNNVNCFVLISSWDASSKSRIFYSTMKGQLEQRISELDFFQYVIFRPGPLMRKDSDRFGERLAVKTIKILNVIGLFRKFKPLSTEVLAGKLIKAPKAVCSGTTIVMLENIFDF